jgi:hypothetical protein
MITTIVIRNEQRTSLGEKRQSRPSRLQLLALLQRFE